jgi:hypothetical protein
MVKSAAFSVNRKIGRAGNAYGRQRLFLQCRRIKNIFLTKCGGGVKKINVVFLIPLMELR